MFFCMHSSLVLVVPSPSLRLLRRLPEPCSLLAACMRRPAYRQLQARRSTIRSTRADLQSNCYRLPRRVNHKDDSSWIRVAERTAV